MKKLVFGMVLALIAQSSFAFYEGSSKLSQALIAEIFFSTAVSSVGSEASSFSTSDAKKQEARKIQLEVQEYNQSSHLTNYLAEKVEIVKSHDETLSTDEAVDVLIDVTEMILSK